MKRFISIIAAFTIVIAGAMPLSSGVATAASHDSYIIAFRSGVDPRQAASDVARTHGLSTRFVYEHAFNGMAAQVPSGRLQALARDPRVTYVEKDQQVSIANQVTPTGVKRSFAEANANLTINAVDDKRIDADIAIIDTGVDPTHPDLNVHAITDCTGGSPFKSSCKDGSGSDGNGHGTHVAGSAAAIDNGIGVVGVAPGARIWSARVLDNNGSGYMSWIIAGVDWVTKHSDQIEVANMSLGCECTSSSLNTAIGNSVAKGVTYAVAAGNNNKDAATFSPANHPDVITVSALADFDGIAGALGSPTCRADQDDTLADFSNWGSTVEIAAPGVCIRSTWPGGGYNTISGTSMASPHVAGAAAVLAVSGSYTAVQIRATLRQQGNYNWTDSAPDGVREPLLDLNNTTVFNPRTINGSESGPTENAPPTAEFSFTTSGLTATFTDTSTDSDGTIQSWNWDFGDGSGTSTQQHPVYTYVAAGTYNVSLTVTDDKGATASVMKQLTVSDDTAGFTLSTTGYKVKGVQHADLAWSGASTSNIDVYRNNTRIATVANTGAYTDNINTKGSGTYTYMVCEAGSSVCSNTSTVVF